VSDTRVPTVLGVPTYNGADRLSWLLESVYLRPPWPDDIVVVDDGSPRVNETRAAVDRFRGKLPVNLCEHGVNRGIAAGWNSCVSRRQFSGAECNIILANDDVIVSGEWLESLVYVLDHSPAAGVVGASWHAFLPEDVPELLRSADSDLDVCPRDPVSKVQKPERRREFEGCRPGRAMAPTGQLFAFRVSDWAAVGGFDEEYKSFYEESDFGTAMAAKLQKIGVQTAWPFCWHLWSATFGANPELQAGARIAASRAHYRKKWGVPEGIHEFDYTNPKHLGAVGDVEVCYLLPGGVEARGVLMRDGRFQDIDL
jgi:glycosyltransferase involved in cell wall biosynthesis